MTRPIVHVGYPKTATTWFQRSFYPQVRGHTYIPRERVSRAFLSATAFHFDPAWSLRELALTPGAPPILCEEALIGTAYTGGFMGLLTAEVARRIRAVLPEARIVLFTRAQPEIIASTYLQYLRVGGTFAPNRFLWADDYRLASDLRPNRVAHFAFEHFEYDRVIAHYIELFGADRVHAFAYEQLRDEGNGFLEQVARALDLEVDVASIPMARRNVALGRGTAQLARVLNHFTAHKLPDKRIWLHIPHWYRRRKKVLNWIDRRRLLGGSPSAEEVLGADVIAWIRQRYCESNRRLAQLVGTDLAALGYTLTAPSQPAPRPEPSRLRRWLAQ